MINSYIYLYHLDKQFNIPVTPDPITNSLGVTFSTENILGRSAPQITFASAGPRTQSISLTLHRQLTALENDGNENAVDDLINALQACTLPKYMDSYKAVIPPSLLIRFGNESCIRGVINGQLTVTSSGAWLKSGKMSVVTLTFVVTEVEPFSAEYAMQKGLLRSVSTDLRRNSVWMY